MLPIWTPSFEGLGFHRSIYVRQVPAGVGTRGFPLLWEGLAPTLTPALPILFPLPTMVPWKLLKSNPSSKGPFQRLPSQHSFSSSAQFLFKSHFILVTCAPDISPATLNTCGLLCVSSAGLAWDFAHSGLHISAEFYHLPGPEIFLRGYGEDDETFEGVLYVA